MEPCKLLLCCVSHLHGHVVQALVVLGLRDRAEFEEGFLGGHLPVVEGPALFLRGQGLPRCLARCVHRASVLPAAGIVPCRCAGFKSGFKVRANSAQSRCITGSKSLDIRLIFLDIPVKSAEQFAQIPHKDRPKSLHFSVKVGWLPASVGRFSGC